MPVTAAIPNSAALPTGRDPRRYEEWRELIEELRKILDEMASAFIISDSHLWDRGGIINVDGDDPDPFAAIKRGNVLIHNRLYIADVFRDSGLLGKWNELVKGAEAGDFPRSPSEVGYSPTSRYIRKQHPFLEESVRVAREDVKK